MDMAADTAVIKQHLIDPEICIRCNTCEATCPVNAITHDDNNYVVRADICNGCMACISPCPTGSIDNWRTMPVVKAYSIEEQFTWDELPAELTQEQLEAEGAGAPVELPPQQAAATAGATEQITDLEPGTAAFNSAQYGATTPPWSAAHAYTNLYGPKAASKRPTSFPLPPTTCPRSAVASVRRIASARATASSSSPATAR